MIMNIFATGEATAATQTPQGGDWSFLIMMGAIFVVFYFILIRPQKKQEKRQRAMIDALKPGDEIITIGGIYGKIVKVKEDYIVIESTADRTKIKFAKSSVSRCLTEHNEEVAEEAKESKEETE